MLNLHQHITKAFGCLLSAAALASCGLIDEDLSKCGNDYELNYELQLVTNMNTELQTQLSTNVNVSSALRTYLSDIFTDFAHDVDLSFYDTEGDSARLHHEQHIMDANQSSYTLYLPMREYMHLAVANISKNNQVALFDDEACHTSQLLELNGAGEPIDGTKSDTIESHTTGIFTARQSMEVLEGVDQTFNVHLYMANCAASLLLNPRGHDFKDVKVYATGFATGFDICDTTYTFVDNAPVVKVSKVPMKDSDELCFCSVTFPSRDSDPTRSIINTDEPFIAPTADEALWKYIVYVTLADGSITQSILYLSQPLRAGQFKLLKVYLADDQGTVASEDNTVGVSVTLNWNPIEYPEIPLGD